MLGLDFRASGFQRLKGLRGFGFRDTDLGLSLGSEVLAGLCVALALCCLLFLEGSF